MTTLNEIVNYIESLLEVSSYKDSSCNGVQVEASKDIGLILGSVDSGLGIIEEAVTRKADLLVVHHGLIWGEGQAPIIGNYGKAVSALIKGGCSLYASHLPLDGNLEVGNGAELARYLEMTKISPCIQYSGATIGVRASFPQKMSIKEVSSKLSQISGAWKPRCLAFGPEEVNEAVIVTGSGSFALQAASQMGVPLLISGEAKQDAYHTARDLGINAIFAGHYATETFGVKALLKKLAAEFDVQTDFIECDTGI